jgi:hypothetical protein
VDSGQGGGVSGTTDNAHKDKEGDGLTIIISQNYVWFGRLPDWECSIFGSIIEQPVCAFLCRDVDTYSITYTSLGAGALHLLGPLPQRDLGGGARSDCATAPGSPVTIHANTQQEDQGQTNSPQSNHTYTTEGNT